MNDVNPKVLRALVARSYELVRHDIPKSKVEADFQMLNSSVETSTTFAKLFGIASIKDYSAPSAQYKHSATQLGKALGGNTWHVANKLIEKLKAESGWNMKASDNIYHRTELINKTTFNKYSDEALELLTKVRDKKPFEIQMD